MKNRVLCFCVMISAATLVHAQTASKEKNGTFYLAFGSQRIWYTNSDIHVKRASPSPAFDFTLYNVRAQDEGGLKWRTAPQFSYTIGYYFKKKNFGLEYHYDHIKYFVTQNQKVRMTGDINGVKYSQDTTLVPQFFMLEHSDGANYAMLNFVKWFPLAASTNKKLVVQLLAKAGAGVVNPKTNSTIMGTHRDDRYHISGYVTGVETGLRFSLFKYFIATGSFKGTYANYGDFLIAGGKGSQQW
ncbi:MAG TPA: hypothetical protein VNR87_03510 [Flavisolibacter sp.]|nr:hypothetical protein [Flavisolibacter sp.]